VELRDLSAFHGCIYLLTFSIADRREFIKISQAVGVGFLVMGAVGYLVKLSELLSLGGGVSRTNIWIFSSHSRQ
jgi:hypothetical protein